MTVHPFLTILITIQLLISCTPNSSSAEEEVLFTEGTENWMIGGTSTWAFNGLELVGKSDSGSGFVMTNKVYGDFELTLEFKPDSTVNSGVFLRCKEQELSADDCYEINIWDLHPNQDYRTGAIVKRSTPAAIVETLNKWNKYQIKVQGNQIQVTINGIETANMTDDDLIQGYIGLQAAGLGEIRFRNVKVRMLRTD